MAGPFPLSPAAESRIEKLISKMTLEEKAGQLNMPSDAGSIPGEDIRSGRVGIAICAISAYAGNERQESVRVQVINNLQRIAIRESRLGIPLLLGRDVIHGHRTVFPIPLGQAAAWDEGLVEEMARISALEGAASGIRWFFTPMMDIARDARWGRTAEGFGEDPYLASQLAKAAIRGYQGTDLSDRERIATCIKHYAGYGAVEGGRDYNTCEITENTLRNVYLPPFKAAIEAGAATLMAAFTEIGGVPAPANHWLLTTVLKEEWGFQGPVVSDWGAVKELIKHGVAADEAHAAELALNAGIDVDMATTCYLDHIPELVKTGRVTEERVNDAVRRVLRAKLALGLFEGWETPADLDTRVHRLPESVALARKAASQGCVLLKNSGILPLEGGDQKLAMTGPLVNATHHMFGTWTLDGEGSDVVPFAQAILERAPNTWVSDIPDEGVSVARFCDAAIVILGESSSRSGEDNTVTTIELPHGQSQIVRDLKRLGVPTIVVVISGRPLDLSEIVESADAVIWSAHPGVEGPRAILDVVFGDVEPGGRLPFTMPRSTGQVPIYYNHKPTGRPLDPYARGRTRIIDMVDSPLFPFGFGLTYSTFEVGAASSVEKEGKVILAADVTNTGSRLASAVVQLYTRDVVASTTRPVKELKRFCRVTLDPQDTARIFFELTKDDLAFFGAKGTIEFEPGEFVAWIGLDSRFGSEVRFTLS